MSLKSETAQEAESGAESGLVEELPSAGSPEEASPMSRPKEELGIEAGIRHAGN